jgi:hypothetical protein
MESLHDILVAHWDHEPQVGRDSVEPNFERSEANAVSILSGSGSKVARCARTVCNGRISSTESRPTVRFMGGEIRAGGREMLTIQ